MTDKIQNRLAALKEKHAQLDALIEQENAYPRPDDTKIHEYKKQKLKVKEEIEEIEKNM
jgi:hypothetical protein